MRPQCRKCSFRGPKFNPLELRLHKLPPYSPKNNKILAAPLSVTANMNLIGERFFGIVIVLLSWPGLKHLHVIYMCNEQSVTKKLNPPSSVGAGEITFSTGRRLRPRTHGNVFLRFCIVYCSQGNREQPAHYLKQYKNAGKRFRVNGALKHCFKETWRKKGLTIW